MPKHEDLINNLYEAKAIVEEKAKSMFGLELRLEEPIVISAKEIEEILNNSKFVVREVQLSSSSIPDEKDIESARNGKIIKLVNFNKIESALLKLGDICKTLKIYRIEPIYFANYSNLCSGLIVGLTFMQPKEYKLSELLKIENEIREIDSSINFIVTYYETADERFKILFDNEFIPSQVLSHYKSLEVRYDEERRKFTVTPWANAERGNIFVLERMERFNPVTQLSIGLHEYFHKIDGYLYNLYKEHIPEINEIILERIETFCKEYNLQIEKGKNRIVINYRDNRIEIWFDQNYVTLSPGHFLTHETLVELETLKTLEEIGYSLGPLRKCRIEEMETSDILRKLIIYAGYLTAHECHKIRLK